jgi:hypothetical protein
MYPSFFRFKKLIEQDHQDQKDQQDQPREIENNSITNNLEEFKILFKTQEKACYELRSENTVLKMKLEVANEVIRVQSKKIQSVKMKKNKLQIENNVYKNILSSSLSLNNNNNNNNNSSMKFIKNEERHDSHTHAYPPPPPPPLPLPPPPVNKMKVNGNFQMNSVLDELKSKIKRIE